MNDEKLNMSLRKFLKEVGVTSQRRIEQAVAESGRASGRIEITATVEAPELGLRHEVRGEIDLG